LEEKRTKSRNLAFLTKKITILDEIWTKIRNLDRILDAVGDFGQTKNDILDQIFLVSLIMLVAQYKSNPDITVVLVSSMQIVTGIEFNSEAYFPKLREYCPSAEGTLAIFQQLREIRLTIDR